MILYSTFTKKDSNRHLTSNSEHFFVPLRIETAKVPTTYRLLKNPQLEISKKFLISFKKNFKKILGFYKKD